MIGGLKKVSLYLFAGASAFAILASAAPAAKAQYVTRQEFEDYKKSQPEVKWKGAPEFKSEDGKFSFKVRGRIMVDYNGIDQDEPITGDPDISGVELRRARLGVEGTIYYDWKYKFEYDFAGDGEIKDAYVAYANFFDGLEKSEIRLGNQYVYNSLEEITSSRFITFMERAAFIEAFFLDRQIGAAVVLGDKNWSFQSGYYGATVEDQGDFSTDQTAFSVRGTIAPINTDTTVVHLGASYRHRDAGTLDGAADLYRYRARPDLHLADRFVATPNFADSDDMYVLEGAFVWNRFSVQGEYANLTADTPVTIANASPDYNGWYIEASVFLTDDMRNYEADEGAFGRQKVKNPVWGGSGGFGAWQVAARYDSLELGSDATLFNASTRPNAVMCDECGSQDLWTLGLNWWLTDHTALKFNYVNAEIDGGNNNGATIQGFGMRGQIDW